MTDLIDKASENSEAFLAEALAKQANKNITTVSNDYCDDCGQAIPEARRQIINCTRCVPCQEYFENTFR